MTPPPECLLIIPTTFHSFAKNIVSALSAAGYAVTVANDEYPANWLGKLMGKLDLPIVRTLTRRAIERQFLRGRRYALIAIFKGRGVGPDLVALLKAHGDRVVGYHFDSLAYDPASRRWGDGIDRVSTFDYHDAAAENWPLVELFSTLPPPSPLPTPRYRISAIVRNHSQRLAYVDRVVDATGADDSFIYFYEKDWPAWALRALRHPRLYWKWRRHISFTPLAYETYIDTLARSAFTIDFAHPKQTGATIRCFEARAVGARIITNNPHVVDSKSFGPDRAIVFRPGDNPAELAAALVEYGRRPRPAAEQRTPLAFIAEVIGDVLPPP